MSIQEMGPSVPVPAARAEMKESLQRMLGHWIDQDLAIGAKLDVGDLPDEAIAAAAAAAVETLMAWLPGPIRRLPTCQQ